MAGAGRLANALSAIHTYSNEADEEFLLSHQT